MTKTRPTISPGDTGALPANSLAISANPVVPAKP